MPTFENILAAKEAPSPRTASTDPTDDPFGDKNIADSNFLDDVSSRQVCPVCSKRRKFFCYSCLVPMADIADRIPSVALPLKLEVIKHPKEVEGKSTAVHAAILATADTAIHTWPDIPDYDADSTLLVFPCDSSITLARLAEEWKGKHAEEDAFGQRNVEDGTGKEDVEGEPPKKCAKRTNLPFDKIVFIESTWNQAHSIFTDERLSRLKRVQLEDYETHFWRYQRGKPSNFLSTIEAIYWFFVEFDNNFSDGTTCFDNLLFFFAYMHSKIFKLYDGNLKVTEERRNRLADRQKSEAKSKETPT